MTPETSSDVVAVFAILMAIYGLLLVGLWPVNKWPRKKADGLFVTALLGGVSIIFCLVYIAYVLAL
jgi:hypothetical protein